MFRLGRHHARLSQWHKDLVGADNVAANARLRGAADPVSDPLKDAEHRKVVRVNGRALRRASREPRSLSAVNRSRVVRPFARC